MRPSSLAALAALLPLLVAGDAVEIVHKSGANLQRPVWSPDGTQLGYEANFHDEKRVELYVGDPATKVFRRVTPAVRSASSLTAGFSTGADVGQVAHELTWSPPSMGRFVYSATNDLADYEIYLGGGGPLTSEPGADGGPAWSPDGAWVAFTSGRTGQGDLYLLEVAAIEAPPKRLTSLARSSELFVAWSPTSDALAFVAHSNQGDNLWLLPALDAPEVQLTRWTGTQTRPRFSPDGTHIAFYADHNDEGRIDLYVMPAKAGAEPFAVLEGVVPNATGPCWTPDSGHLVVVRDNDDRFDPIVAVSARGAGATELALGTVGHGDLDLVAGKEGKLTLAYVAQGIAGDEERTFKRLFLAEIAAP